MDDNEVFTCGDGCQLQEDTFYSGSEVIFESQTHLGKIEFFKDDDKIFEINIVDMEGSKLDPGDFINSNCLEGSRWAAPLTYAGIYGTVGGIQDLYRYSYGDGGCEFNKFKVAGLADVNILVVDPATSDRYAYQSSSLIEKVFTGETQTASLLDRELTECNIIDYQNSGCCTDPTGPECAACSC